MDGDVEAACGFVEKGISVCVGDDEEAGFDLGCRVFVGFLCGGVVVDGCVGWMLWFLEIVKMGFLVARERDGRWYFIRGSVWIFDDALRFAYTAYTAYTALMTV